MFKTIDLAKYIVTKCTKEHCSITNLQLQKILCSIQEHFQQKGKRAFGDNIGNWQCGPVIPNVYYYFGGFGAMPISTTYDIIFPVTKEKLEIDTIIVAKRKLQPWEWGL